MWRYTVGFWDTVTGTVLSTATVDGVMSIPLPAFTTDLALKVKPGW